jgi:hypothetical protein
MSTTPNIGYQHMSPQYAFNDNCSYNGWKIDGSFDFRPYQLCIAAAVLVYLHSLIFTLYYILPLDENSHKFIPGLEALFASCNRGEQLKYVCQRISEFLKAFSKFIEMIGDGLLLIITLTACIIASIVIERGSRFEFTSPGATDDGTPTIEYYTVGTFFSTFEHTSPVCINEDPSSKIRASIAMLYFTMFMVFLSLQVSVRSFRQEMRLRAAQGEQGFTSLPSVARDESDSMHNGLMRSRDDVVEVNL